MSRKEFKIYPEKDSGKQGPLFLDKHVHDLDLLLPIGGKTHYSNPIARLLYEIIQYKKGPLGKKI